MDEEKMTSVKKQLDEIARVPKFNINKFNFILGGFLVVGGVVVATLTNFMALSIIGAMYGMYLMYTSEKEINGCI